MSDADCFKAVDLDHDPAPGSALTDPAPGSGLTDPAPGSALTDPAPGSALTDPAPGSALTDPAPGSALTDPAPGSALTDPAPGSALTDPAPGSALTDPAPGSALTDPAPGSALTDPAPGSALTDPAPGSALTDPAPGSALTDPAPGSALTDPAPGSALTDPAPGSALTDPAPGSALTDPAPGSALTDPAPSPVQPAEQSPPALQPLVTPAAEIPQLKESKWTSAVTQFKLKRFFVLRPGTLEQAVEEVRSLVDQQVDGTVLGTWLLAEVDHWNNEKERLLLITERSLLVCKYDFVMLNCDTIQRIPLNYVDRIAHGNFTFPPRSLLSREGEGVRVFWDRMREPSFRSRWNPFSTDYPFNTFISHPVRSTSDKLASLCDVQGFQEQLVVAAREAHSRGPVPGKANGVLVLNQPLFIDATVGLMALIGNQNKLGYCLARGNIGF